MTARVAIALGALMLAAGCVEDALTSGPFPCASDGTCPDELTCMVGVTASLGGVCTDPCASSIECEDGSRCGQAGEAGGCMAECAPFGTDCEGGTSCRLQPLRGEEGFFATCVVVVAGEGEMFAPCDTAMDCPRFAACFRGAAEEPFTCHPQCDDAHPCRRGKSCQVLLPSGAGVCR